MKPHLRKEQQKKKKTSNKQHQHHHFKWTSAKVTSVWVGIVYNIFCRPNPSTEFVVLSTYGIDHVV